MAVTPAQPTMTGDSKSLPLFEGVSVSGANENSPDLPGLSVDLRPHGLGAGLIALLAVLIAVFLCHIAMAEAACSECPRAGMDWTGSDKSHLHLQGKDLSAAVMSRANLIRSDFLDARRRDAVPSEAILSRTRFGSANLRGADLSQTHAFRDRFLDASLLGATLGKADLHQAEFGRANLQGANMAEGNFQEAYFREACLREADLRRSSLLGADLRGADLTDARLGGANLFGARVEGTDLSGVRGISEAQVGEACGDAATKLPGPVVKPPRWPCAGSG